MDNHNILVLKNAVSTQERLITYLEHSGFAVQEFKDGLQLKQLLTKFRPDLIIINKIFPPEGGQRFLRALRNSNDWTPIILTSKDYDTVEAAIILSEGADDYLAEGTEILEFTARIFAVLRRTQIIKNVSGSKGLRSGDLILDQGRRSVCLQTKELFVTPKSFAILEYLMIHSNEIISREKLLDELWGWDCAAHDRIIDVRIWELRKALNCHSSDPIFIETVLGVGYRFIGDVVQLP